MLMALGKAPIRPHPSAQPVLSNAKASIRPSGLPLAMWAIMVWYRTVATRLGPPPTDSCAKKTRVPKPASTEDREGLTA